MQIRSRLLIAPLLLLAGLGPAACRTAPPAAVDAADAAEAVDAAPVSPSKAKPAETVVTVPERFVSDPQPGNLDSLATWHGPDGRSWLMVSAKGEHRLLVFDAATGERLQAVGARGSGPGQFNRPNGLAVAGDRLFVVERDNHRVQVLRLPDFAPVGTFGEDRLRSPYGLWLQPHADGVTAFVTDSFMYGPRYEVVPPLEELAERVRRYRVRFDGDELEARYADSFGATDEANALRIVESIAGDPAHDRLLIADESMPASTLREYRFDGSATGRNLPPERFAAEAEGVALWTCGEGGYWVTADQLSPLTRFHLFERRTLAPAGTFSGRTTAFTDGIALDTTGTATFPSGALYAVHHDKAVAAFDLRDVVTALGLDPACAR